MSFCLLTSLNRRVSPNTDSYLSLRPLSPGPGHVVFKIDRKFDSESRLVRSGLPSCVSLLASVSVSALFHLCLLSPVRKSSISVLALLCLFFDPWLERDTCTSRATFGNSSPGCLGYWWTLSWAVDTVTGIAVGRWLAS